MSKLKEYRKSRKISQSDFAGRIGAEQGTISKIENGAQLPSLDLAVKIQRETGGAVLPADFVPIKAERPNVEPAQ